MNKFQKISSAVIIFGLLGLGACVSSQPSEPAKGSMCIGTPEDQEVWDACEEYLKSRTSK